MAVREEEDNERATQLTRGICTDEASTRNVVGVTAELDPDFRQLNPHRRPSTATVAADALADGEVFTSTEFHEVVAAARRPFQIEDTAHRHITFNCSTGMFYITSVCQSQLSIADRAGFLERRPRTLATFETSGTNLMSSILDCVPKKRATLYLTITLSFLERLLRFLLRCVVRKRGLSYGKGVCLSVRPSVCPSQREL